MFSKPARTCIPAAVCTCCAGISLLPASVISARCHAGSPGTLDLGPTAACELVSRLRQVRAAPCFSLMAALPRAVPGRTRTRDLAGAAAAGGGGGAGAGARAFDAASMAGSRELAWVACDSSKPGAACLGKPYHKT